MKSHLKCSQGSPQPQSPKHYCFLYWQGLAPSNKMLRKTASLGCHTRTYFDQEACPEVLRMLCFREACREVGCQTQLEGAGPASCYTLPSWIHQIRLGVKMFQDVINGIRGNNTACQPVFSWQFWGKETAYWSAEEGRRTSQRGSVEQRATWFLRYKSGPRWRGSGESDFSSLNLGFWMQATTPKPFHIGQEWQKFAYGISDPGCSPGSKSREEGLWGLLFLKGAGGSLQPTLCSDKARKCNWELRAPGANLEMIESCGCFVSIGAMGLAPAQCRWIPWCWQTCSSAPIWTK